MARNNKSKKGMLLIILLLVVLIGGYLIMKKDNGNVRSSSANTIAIASMGEPYTLDAQYSTGTWESIIIENMISGLFSKDAKGHDVPELVEKYTVSKDAKTYTFHLKDATWSDGIPVTADDFVYAYKRMLDPKQATTYAQLLYVIKGAEAFNTGKSDSNAVKVKAINPKTLQIELEYPASYFINMLQHYSFYPVPKHVVEKYGKQWTKPDNIVVNGAYKLVEWKSNNYIKLVKNDKYWDANKVTIQNVYFYTQEDRATVLKRFRAKEVDIADDFESDKYDWIMENLSEEVKVYPYLGIYYFAVNVTGNTNPALANKSVRQALAMAIDREFITKRILKSGQVPAYSFIPEGIEGYTPAKVSWQKLSKEQRIAKAKEILKEAGYDEKNPLNIEIAYNTSEDHKKVVVALANMWKEIGVNTKVENSEVAVHYKNMEGGTYQIGRAGWIADYDEPSSLLYVAEKNVGNNYSKYKSDKFNNLMVKAKQSLNVKEKYNLYNKAEEILLEDMPYIPVYYYVSKALVSQRIGGYENNISNKHLVKYLFIKQ